MTNENVSITSLLSNHTTIRLVSAPNKITDASKFEVSCSDCNINWSTCIRVLKKGIYCPACQVKGSLNQEQALFVISKRLPQMKFIRFPDGFKSNSSFVTLQCLKNEEHVIIIS
jgi:late competence protein required for DNA uptake (superfamily II DNA/RNA helicase)